MEKVMSKNARNTNTLRNVLFDEIDELRAGKGDHKKAVAVAQLSKQIINIARVEMQYHEMIVRSQEAGRTLKLGAMELGSTGDQAQDGT